MNCDRWDTAVLHVELVPSFRSISFAFPEKEIGVTYCLLLDRACQASLVRMGTLEIQKIQKIRNTATF